MDKACIYVDLNEMVEYDILLLSKDDTKTDSHGNIDLKTLMHESELKNN